MPLLDIEAMNRSLDNDYGATRGPHAADNLEMALFMGDPMEDGIEVTGGGYAPAAINVDTGWLDADDGYKTMSTPASFPAPTGAYPDTVTHWALRDPVENLTWDTGPLTEELDVTTASPGVPILVLVSVFYDDAVTEEP